MAQLQIVASGAVVEEEDLSKLPKRPSFIIERTWRGVVE
jgi:hypothetical protein